MNDDDLIRRGDVIAILSAASRTAQKTIDAIAAIPAIAASQPADPVINAGCFQPVRAKPMAWVKHPSKDIWRSDQPFGTYKVFGVGRTPSWDFDSLSNGQDKISKTADSVNAAKAAAQADYEARILSAIEPAPVTLDKCSKCGGSGLVLGDCGDPQICPLCHGDTVEHLAPVTLAGALQVPEVRALVDAAMVAKLALAEHEPYPLPACQSLLVALRAIEEGK